MSIYR